MKHFPHARLLTGLLLTLLQTASAFADMVYHVTVDTSAVSGTSGYLDVQFNPGDSSAAAATALLSGFSGNIAVLGSAVNSGDASGALPGNLLLGNGSAFNDVFQSVLFGTSFAFDLSLGGDFLTSGLGVGTAFAISLYAADQSTPLLTTDANATVLTSLLGAGGSVVHQTFAADALGSPSVVSLTPVPLPAAAWLLLSGLGLLPWGSKRHARVRP